MKKIKKFIPGIVFLVTWLVIYWMSYPLRPFDGFHLFQFRVLSLLCSVVTSGITAAAIYDLM